MPEAPEEPLRVRLPRRGEVIGEISGLLGASRFMVKCTDGKERMARIPGKFRKRITIRLGFIVLVEPWSVEGDAKCDIVWIYTPTQSQWLRKNGHLK